MNPLYHELAERFWGETKDLDRTVQRTLRAWERAQTATNDQDIYPNSVALNLHGFYSGLERLFELVAYADEIADQTGSQDKSREAKGS